MHLRIILFISFLLLHSATAESQTTQNRGLDPSFFIGTLADSPSRTAYGNLRIKDLLAKPSGEGAMKRGEVLMYLNRVSFAALGSGRTTRNIRLKGIQQVYYVVYGEGRLSFKGETIRIHEGSAFLAPPGVDFRITNTGKESLAAYIIEEAIPPGFRTGDTIIVRHEYDFPISSNVTGARSSLFGQEDGLVYIQALNFVMQEPGTARRLHVHPPQQEEIWIALQDELEVIIGTRNMGLPPWTAYKSPADNRTPHSNINRGKTSKKTFWIMAGPRRTKFSDSR